MGKEVGEEGTEGAREGGRRGRVTRESQAASEGGEGVRRGVNAQLGAQRNTPPGLSWTGLAWCRQARTDTFVSIQDLSGSGLFSTSSVVK